MNKNAELILTKEKPSLDGWLAEAEAQAYAGECGMYLFHTGVVRAVPKAAARTGLTDARPVKGGPDGFCTDTGSSEKAAPIRPVTGMDFSYDREKAEAALQRALRLPGIFHVRVWLNEGKLAVGDPLMQVLVGGDIRPRVIAALESLVEELKTFCVTETEF